MNLFDKTIYLTIFALIILTPACNRPPISTEIPSVAIIKSFLNTSAKKYVSKIEKQVIEDFCRSFEKKA